MIAANMKRIQEKILQIAFKLQKSTYIIQSFEYLIIDSSIIWLWYSDRLLLILSKIIPAMPYHNENETSQYLTFCLSISRLFASYLPCGWLGRSEMSVENFNRIYKRISNRKPTVKTNYKIHPLCSIPRITCLI